MLETISPMKTAVATDLEPARKGDADKRGRNAAKEVRQVQLIEATIESLAKRDYSETTMADVAGLSRGIVNFHFESKEKAPELKQPMVAEFEKIKAGY